MFKKIIILTAIFFGWSAPVFAASFYVAPMLSYISAKNSDDTAIFQGLLPKIGVGYGDLLFNPFFFSVEGSFYPLKPMRINILQNAQGASPRPAWIASISVLPGIDLDGVIRLYGRAGFSTANFDQGGGGQKGGAILGVGAETNIFECWYIRGEYVFHAYQALDGGIGSVNIDELSIGVVYRFGNP